MRRRVILTVSVFLVLGSVSPVLALAPGVDEAPWGAWVTRTVDDGNVHTGSVGLALDDTGSAHIAYGACAPDDCGGIYYTTQTGLASWSRELVAVNALTPALALDSQAHPHLVYREGFPTGWTHYATPTQSGWQFEVVEQTASSRPQIAVDTQDTLHVAYTAGEEVHYATRTQTGWQPETVEGLDSAWIDIAVGPNDQPHLVYWAGPGSDAIHYATKTTQGGWVIEEHPGCASDVSIAVDPARGVHVSCMSDDGLVYLYRDPNTSEWSREIVSDGSDLVPPRSSIDVGFDTSIALDSHLRPHITFATRHIPLTNGDPWFTGRLYYAGQVGEGWVTEVVDGTAYWNGRPSEIAIDDQNQPHIAHVMAKSTHRGCGDVTNSCFDLRYAVPASALPSNVLAG